MTRQGKSEITYLEEIVNTRMFNVFQRYVIACSHVLISHGLLKPFPSQIFIFNNIHRNPLRRLRRVRRSSLGWGDFNGHRQVYIMDLDGQLRCRRDRKARLENPRLGRPMLHLLVFSTTGKVSQIQRLG